MDPEANPVQQLLESLQERAKELNCLYRVDEILADPGRPLPQVLQDLVDALPGGWKHAGSCRARIRILDCERTTAGFVTTPWSMSAPIEIDGEAGGEVAVHYLEQQPVADEGPFLKEERKLITAIAERVGFFVTRRALREAHDRLQHAQDVAAKHESDDWRAVFEFLRGTDAHLLGRITRRMINHLVLRGVQGADQLLQEFLTEVGGGRQQPLDDNVPQRKARPQDLAQLGEATFRLAARQLGEKRMVAAIRGWIEEEKSSFLIEVLEDQSSALPQIIEAIERYRSTVGDASNMSMPARRTISSSVIRRLFTDEHEFVNVAKDFVDLEDVYDLVSRVVYPQQSHGKLGGKSAGLFLASQIARRSGGGDAPMREFKVPRTWYVSSDALLEFLSYNSLKDLYFRKYMEIEQVRQEYPHIIQVLKNSHFPPEISRGLALALDDFEDRPLIVRSSSLLEDRVGSTFAGKYKSLFLANRGTRRERLLALQDAIAEIYASIFSPDPIEYRAARGLLDEHEEMGIMIQEVVGTKVGQYFLPAFAGVAFSNNDFRWSARIRRDDGLLRMVPGLGTRAVDRTGDDYPVLAAPGQPGLRVNATAEEVRRYAPRWVDVINLENNTFETIAIRELLRQHGDQYPAVRQVVSIADHDRLRPPMGLEPDFEKDEMVVTFEGLFTTTDFLPRMNALLALLREKLGRAVDVEFASDGRDLYLLQCRSQSFSEQYAPAPIPRNLPRDTVLFTAYRNIANGRVPELTHVVYVDPEHYAQVGTLRELQDVGRAIGRLNKVLPKRRFLLIGPGRWGSRGDIRLGVHVTYADINNTCALVEVARKKGNYVPELSFGTHFFQDLVEADIRYIPIYPDDPGVVFDESFFRNSRNLLAELAPEFAALADVIRVIDITRETDGCVLRVAMNADLDEAVAYFDLPSHEVDRPRTLGPTTETVTDSHSRWRVRMAEILAERLDTERFQVRGIYLFGSVKNGNARADSDIDLLVHDAGAGQIRDDLKLWLDGWSHALAEINFLRTGYRCDGLLDIQFVTDEDIATQTSYAAKIGAATDTARPLTLGAVG